MLSNERGLTLIELCLTLLVLGLLVAAASPNLSHALSALKLKSEAESVATNLQMAIQKCRISGIPHRIQVMEDGKSYVIGRQSWEDSPDRPAWDPVTDWQVIVRNALSTGSKLQPAGEAFVLDPAETRKNVLLTLVHDDKLVYKIQLDGEGNASATAE